jgi:hypothetical protein
MRSINVQKVQVGNLTAMCPQVAKNETGALDQSCVAYKELKTCVDACPDSPIKKMSLSPFKLLQFICIERNDDYKKHMPCLSGICPDVQRACVPKCGSIEESTQKLAALMFQSFGGRPGGPPGSSVTAPPSPGKDVDSKDVAKVAGETCTKMKCFFDCGEGTVTKQCGKDGYLLYRDFTWNMFSSMVQSMSSIGLQSEWPEECKGLASASTTGTTVKGSDVTVRPAGETTTLKTELTESGAAATFIPSLLLLLVTVIVALRGFVIIQNA